MIRIDELGKFNKTGKLCLIRVEKYEPCKYPSYNCIYMVDTDITSDIFCSKPNHLHWGYCIGHISNK